MRFSQEVKQLPPVDQQFITGLVQMLSALYKTGAAQGDGKAGRLSRQEKSSQSAE